jgi:hypothetical protein
MTREDIDVQGEAAAVRTLDQTRYSHAVWGCDAAAGSRLGYRRQDELAAFTTRTAP